MTEPTGPWFNPVAEFLGAAYLRNAFTYDRYALFHDGELVEWFPETGRSRLGPDWRFDWTFVLADPRIPGLREAARALVAAS